MINLKYRNALSKASFLLNDGIGVELAGRLSGVIFKDNLNGTDLIPEVLKKMPDGCKIFLLGAKEGVAKNAMRELVNDGLNVVGCHSGFFDDNENVLTEIINSNANVLVLGMGVPKQEIWLNDNIEYLPNIKLSLVGGAIIDFISKEIRRAPKLVREIRLEWLFRLLLEPKRMWKRYLIGNLKFIYHIIKNKKHEK